MMYFFLFVLMSYVLPEGHVKLSKQEVTLSGAVEMTITIVPKSAQYRIELPQQILDSASMKAWKVTSKGQIQSPEQWQQSFLLEPYIPGESVPVQVAPLMVYIGNNTVPDTVSFEPMTVKVTTIHANSTAADALGYTEYEYPSGEERNKNTEWLGLYVGVIFGLIVFAVWKWRRKTKLSIEQNLVQSALAKMNPETTTPEELAAAVRLLAGERHGFDASTKTTAELLERIQFNKGEWVTVLEIADLARFTGRDFTVEERAKVFDSLKTILN